MRIDQTFIRDRESAQLAGLLIQQCGLAYEKSLSYTLNDVMQRAPEDDEEFPVYVASGNKATTAEILRRVEAWKTSESRKQWMAEDR